MPDLTALPGELRATIEIKRAATGKIDTFEIVGRVMPDEGENHGED